ncbi:MAG: CvpA family protein [Bacteroidales bacterium]|nr:CvpA family protein [Bacteroidales bacterium]
MGTIDIIIAACFLPAIFLGLKNGFVRQLVALAVIVLGLWASAKFSDTVAQWLSQRFSWEPFWIKAVSFAAIFLAVALVLNLLGTLLEKLLNITLLGWLNRLLGLALSLVTCALIVGTLIYLVNSANNLISFIPEEKLAESRFFKPLLKLVETVFPYLKQLF